MKRRLAILVYLLAGVLSAFSQNEKYDFEFYGWINPQYFINSRQTAGARDGLLSLYPLPPRYSATGEDLNDKVNHNFSAATTRIGARIRLFDVMGAQILGNIEGDFTGQSDPNMHLLRLRQANVRVLFSDRLSLMAGHGWSVFCVPEMMPQMQELNNGTPFHPFSRLNQIRLDYSPAQPINLVASLGWQRDYATIGIDGKRDYKQQSRSMIPEINLQFQYRRGGLFAGVTGETKTIQPREDCSNTLTTYAVNGFARYKSDNVSVKVEALWGENLNDYCLFGGYSEREVGVGTGEFEYKPTEMAAVWAEAMYDFPKLTCAVFVGYAEHGGKDSDYAFHHGTAMDLENVLRIAPRVEYHFSKDFTLCSTIEYTSVKYADEVSKSRLDNWRFALMLLYKFSTK